MNGPPATCGRASVYNSREKKKLKEHTPFNTRNTSRHKVQDGCASTCLHAVPALQPPPPTEHERDAQ